EFELGIERGTVVGYIVVTPVVRCETVVLSSDLSSEHGPGLNFGADSKLVSDAEKGDAAPGLEEDFNMDAKVEMKIVGNGTGIPQYEHEMDNGMDLMSAETLDLAPFERRVVKLGVAINLPEGLMAQIQPRSGLAIREGLSIVDSPAIVKRDQLGRELDVCLVNLDPSSPIHIERGDRVAQLVIMKSPKVTLEMVDELDETQRGERGFGSSGR
ncbi:MAG: dUTP diphosphatase, partial [Coriobacteriales bacterium]